MTRGFGKGWQTAGLRGGGGGGGARRRRFKGTAGPPAPCSAAPELRALQAARTPRVTCAGARAWRLGVCPPPRGFADDFACLRVALLASLLLTQHLPLGRLESVPIRAVVPAARSPPPPPPLGEGLI